MTQLGLTLLGGFEATLGSRALTFARKAQALLAFLALSRGHASSRAQLMALLWAERGERQKAHDLLAPVYGWFTEGFDTQDLKDAKVLLDELG